MKSGGKRAAGKTISIVSDSSGRQAGTYIFEEREEKERKVAHCVRIRLEGRDEWMVDGKQARESTEPRLNERRAADFHSHSFTSHAKH